jgi:hypothetical protein
MMPVPLRLPVGPRLVQHWRLRRARSKLTPELPVTDPHLPEVRSEVDSHRRGDRGSGVIMIMMLLSTTSTEASVAHAPHLHWQTTVQRMSKATDKGARLECKLWDIF